MGRAGQESRGIRGEERLQRLRYHAGEFVLLDAVPHIEQEHAAGPEDAAGFRKRLRLVRKEHGPELADDGVERAIREGQLHSVCLAPLHRTACADRRCHVQHRLIEVGRDDRRAVRQRRCKAAGDHAGAGGDLEHPRRRSCRQPTRQIVRIGLEDQRDEIGFIELRNRPCEQLVDIRFCHGFPPCNCVCAHARNRGSPRKRRSRGKPRTHESALDGLQRLPLIRSRARRGSGWTVAA